MSGHLVSQETREKLRQHALKHNYLPPSNKGKKFSVEHRRKISEAQLKNFENRVKISPINLRIRGSIEYKLWREAVFERDNYTCVWCGARNGLGKHIDLHADHIKPFALFPELRFAIDNGRTLCKDCHAKTDTYKGKLKKGVVN